MPDHQFEDVRLAGLYDLFCPWDPRGDFGFYFPLVMAAGSVLDVGCGTGMLLHRAREQSHQGRLCGLDPAVGMLEQARRRSDAELRAALAAIRTALADGGRFAFETRNPLVHAWEGWIPENAAEIVVDEQYGDWDRQPLTRGSPEIITMARRG